MIIIFGACCDNLEPLGPWAGGGAWTSVNIGICDDQHVLCLSSDTRVTVTILLTRHHIRFHCRNNSDESLYLWAGLWYIELQHSAADRASHIFYLVRYKNIFMRWWHTFRDITGLCDHVSSMWPGDMDQKTKNNCLFFIHSGCSHQLLDLDNGLFSHMRMF